MEDTTNPWLSDCTISSPQSICGKRPQCSADTATGDDQTDGETDGSAQKNTNKVSVFTGGELSKTGPIMISSWCHVVTYRGPRAVHAGEDFELELNGDLFRLKPWRHRSDPSGEAMVSLGLPFHQG